MSEPTNQYSGSGIEYSGKKPNAVSDSSLPNTQPPTSPEPAAPNRKGMLVAGAILLVVVAAGGYWWVQRDQAIPTTVLGDQPIVVDLQGLDEPQAMNGECISSFTVNGIGTDSAKQQRYALSIQLVGDPVDDVALAELMSSDACTGELKLVGETITERLGFAAAQQELITTSYKTKSGTRLILP